MASKEMSPSHYAVFGWVRQAEVELRLAQTPTTISNLFLSYYDHGEYFTNNGKMLQRSKSKQMLTRSRWPHKTDGNINSKTSVWLY